MSRITSLNILLDPSGKDYLAERSGLVIENVWKRLKSFKLKNTELSGDPEAGSVEAKRFCNATAKAYGTARTAGKGDAVKAKPVSVPIEFDKEIVEELEEKDTKLYGVEGLVEKRTNNHAIVMSAELDRKFYSVAYTAATEVHVPANTPIEEALEALIQECENTQNAYVDGVERELMNMALNTANYGKIRNKLDTCVRANVDTTEEEFLAWHGVETDSIIHLPTGCSALLMVYGSVAEPVMTNGYNAEKINLSDAYALELFYYYGCKAVTPDLIFTLVYDEPEEDDDEDEDENAGGGSGTGSGTGEGTGTT